MHAFTDLVDMWKQSRDSKCIQAEVSAPEVVAADSACFKTAARKLQSEINKLAVPLQLCQIEC